MIQPCPECGQIHFPSQPHAKTQGPPQVQILQLGGRKPGSRWARLLVCLVLLINAANGALCAYGAIQTSPWLYVYFNLVAWASIWAIGKVGMA